jgi:hypothetical protein
MIRRILAINGGGIRDVSFLTFMLKLSKYYDKKNIDVLSLFDTFSGVSSGSIVASAFALREQLLQRIAKSNPRVIESALEKINPHYSKDKVSKIIKKLIRMKIVNCSSIVISTMIVFFETEGPHIFYRTTLRKIVSVDGLLFSKYGDTKKKILDKYLDFTISDVPKGRTIVIKSLDVPNITVKIYTNYVTTIKNNIYISNIEQSISEAIDYSSNAPTYFPYNKMSDGGIILNTSLLEQLFLFQDDDLRIFKLNNLISPSTKTIFFDGLIGWVLPILNISINYENKFFRDLLKYKYKKNICIIDFDISNYSIDDINKISELEHIGEKISLNPAIKFIDNKLN